MRLGRGRYRSRELMGNTITHMNLVYQFTVPMFVRMLSALDMILAKAETWVQEQGIDEKELLGTAFAPDMFPLVKQVQIACDHAKGATGRLSLTEVPSHPDTEATIAELRARISKTLEFIKTVPESAFEKALEQKVTLQYFPGMYLEGLDYARGYSLGNFYFHVVTAYDILRMKGLPIGKADYFGGFDMMKKLEEGGAA